MEKTVKVIAADRRMFMALNKCCSTGLAEALAAGADVNARDAHDRPALYMAILNEFPSGVELLVRHGADVQNMPPGYEKLSSPLHMALAFPKSGLVDCLLALGSDPNAPTVEGNFPLHRAVAMGNVLMMEALIKHGAKANVRNGKGERPEDVAIRKGSISLVKRLSSWRQQHDMDDERKRLTTEALVATKNVDPSLSPVRQHCRTRL